MPRAIPVPLREAIATRIAAGEPIAAVAADLDVPFWSARTIWRRYRDGGLAALEPDYARCGRPGLRSPRLIHRAACTLRRRHPGWGAGVIRTLLVERFPEEHVADERTLRRWFQEAGLTRPPPPPREPPPPRATTPHQTWQLDAKEEVRLADGSRASWLLATDEASGATLEPEVFPPGRVEPGRRGARPRGAAGPVRRLGPASRAAGRQRGAVGLGRRPAGRAGLVADRGGGRRAP
jgi:transposase